jgi:hypothetical protein
MSSQNPQQTINRSVWLLTRPLSFARSVPLLATSAEGTAYMCHWGVLVNDLSLVDGRAILARAQEYCGDNDTDLGTMYESFPYENSQNTVSVRRPFGIFVLRSEWLMFSAQYVGSTTMPHERIKEEGKYNYDLRC